MVAPIKSGIAAGQANTEEENTFPLQKDLLLPIFSCLKNPKQLLTVGLVCKQWHTIASDNRLWKVFVTSRWPGLRVYNAPSAYKDTYLRNCRQLAVCSSNTELHQVRTEGIAKLGPFIQVDNQVLFALTNGRLIIKVDCTTGHIAAKIDLNFPSCMSNVHLKDFLVFKEHLSVLMSWKEGRNFHQGIAFFSKDKGEFERVFSIPSKSRILTVMDEDSVLLRESKKICLFNYRTGQFESSLPAIFSSNIWTKDQKVYVKKEQQVHIFCQHSGILLEVLNVPEGTLAFIDGVFYVRDLADPHWDRLRRIEVQNLEAKIETNPPMLLDYCRFSDRGKLSFLSLKGAGDLLFVKIDYTYWMNRFGRENPRFMTRAFQYSRSSILIYDKHRLDHLKKFDFEEPISAHFLSQNGKLIIPKSTVCNQLTIIDLLSELKDND